MILCYSVLLAFILFPYQLAIAVSPVILIPGDGGSRLQVKLNKTSTVSHFCEKTSSDYVDLWVSLEEFTPVSLPCFADNLRLVYDMVHRKTYDSPGVHVRAPGFGGTETIAWLESYHVYLTSYFASMLTMLEKLGYKTNATVFGAPYDFRRAINEQGEWFLNFTKLVEHAYTTNNNTAVTLIAHSMGNMMTLYWLHNKPKAWKQKYVKRFIAISAPWGGTIKPIRALVAGDKFGIYTMTPLVVRAAQRSLPSTHFLISDPRYWEETAILAINRGVKNYTLQNLKELYSDLNITNEWQMFQDSRNLLDPTKPPEVETHCLHGAGVDTPYQFEWNEKYKWPDTQPLVVNGDGDGTVVLRSLAGCLLWKQAEPMRYQSFDKIEHLAALKSPDVINYVYKVLLPESPLLMEMKIKINSFNN